MKSLKEVLGKDKHIWFSIGENDKTAFLQWARDNKCKWMNGDDIKPDKDNCGYHMGISSDLSMGFVSAMCWCLANQGNVRKVQFKEIIGD